MSTLPALESRLAPIPTAVVLGHLVVFLIIPLAIGGLARQLAPVLVERTSSALRVISLVLVIAILAIALATVASQVPALMPDIALAAGLFVVLAMLAGAALGLSFTEEVRNVITIESGVRNIGLALTLGGITMESDDFSILAAFLTGYLAIEIAVILPYAAMVAYRRTGPTARP